MKFAKVIRMSHAEFAINTGEGNSPKRFPDGRLYGSSQSTKRQIMEASGIKKLTRSSKKVEEEYKCKLNLKNEKTEKDKSHTIVWDNTLENEFNKLKNEFESDKLTQEEYDEKCTDVILKGGKSSKIYGHFNTKDGGSSRIDGAYGTTGHRGMHNDKITIDKYTSSTEDNNEEATFIGDKEIADEEYYYSIHSIDFTKYEEVEDELKSILITCATKELHPRANKNGGNILSCEWSTIIYGDDAGFDIPAIGKEYIDHPEVLRNVLSQRNKDKEIILCAWKNGDMEPEEDTLKVKLDW